MSAALAPIAARPANQLAGAVGQRSPDRGQSEQHEPSLQHPPAAEAVAEIAAD